RVVGGDRTGGRAHAERAARRLHRELEPALGKVDFSRKRVFSLARSGAERIDVRGPCEAHDRTSDEFDLNLRALRGVDDIAILDARAFDELVPGRSTENTRASVDDCRYPEIGAVTERGCEEQATCSEPD